MLKNDHLWSFLNIIYTFLGSIFEPCYIQNLVITNRVIQRLKCIDIFLVSPQKYILWALIKTLSEAHLISVWGFSDGNPQHMYSWRNRKNNFLLPPLFFFLELGHLHFFLFFCSFRSTNHKPIHYKIMGYYNNIHHLSLTVSYKLNKSV